MTKWNAKARYRLPSLDGLATFEAAARALSFTKAGDELSITQSAVSKQVKQLEDQLGVALFERRPRALALTEAGHQFRQATVDALDRLQATVDQLQRGSKGTEIAVTMTTTFAAMWLIPRLDRFTVRYPDVDVRISATTTLLDLGRDRLDLAIRICAPHMVPPDSPRLFHADVIAVCSPRLLKDSARPLTSPKDIVNHTLLRCDLPELRGSFMDWGTWLTALGLGDLKPAATLTFNQADQAIQAAAAGQGIALAQSRIVAELINLGTLVAPFGSGIPGGRAFFVVRAPVRDLSPARATAVSAFIGWLIEEARSNDVDGHEKPAIRSSPARLRGEH